MTHPPQSDVRQERDSITAGPTLRIVPDVEPMPAAEKTLGWRALIWCAWFEHSRLMLIFLAAWLALVWVLPVLADPGWILAFGCLYAVIAGPLFGGGDVLEGSEEFAFALPMRRGHLFASRLAVGWGMLAVLTVLDVMALGLDLSQALARFYLDTGLIPARRIHVPWVLSGLVFSLPLAIFSGAFALAANTRSRAMVISSWFWASLVALALLKAGLAYEEYRWRTWNGMASNSMLLGGTAIMLAAGFRCFCRKEIGPPTGRLVLPGWWWLWALLGLAGLTLVALLGQSIAQDFMRWLERASPGL